ncbi:helix-turn-helix domain-containing protein [Brevibacterium album]|uniref:helix-turn-helix domain-containing protein n=1 Tax=Brevibacterium album TaxID=417948 RepID=UPI001B7FD7FD|nr:helix-turn-helix transcriptional regulator [Brevibacterium album]
MTWNGESARRFGATLRRMRQEHGLSQEALAFQAGVTKNQVQLIESGRSSGRKDADGPSNPKISTLVGFATALGVRASSLLDEAGL